MGWGKTKHLWPHLISAYARDPCHLYIIRSLLSSSLVGFQPPFESLYKAHSLQRPLSPNLVLKIKIMLV